MKKLILLAIMLTSYLGFSQLEPKTVVLNGLIVNGKTTANIQALAVAPSGYIQYSTDTKTLWLKTATGWVDTGTAGTDNSLSEVDQIITNIPRVINTIGSGTLSLSDNGIELIRLGDNNDQAIRLLNIEGIGSSIGSFTPITVPSDIYTSLWNGNDEVPTKNDVYDKIQTITAGSSAIVDETSTGTTYTPTDVDNYKLKYLKNVADITVSTPTGTFADGDNITFVQDSVGVLKFDFKDIRKNVFYETTASGAIATAHYTGTGWTFLCGLCTTYSNFPLDNAAFVSSFWAEDLGSDATAIASWNDRISTNNAVQATGTKQPLVDVEADGKKAVKFDGVDDGLGITEVAALDYASGDPMSFVVVTGKSTGTGDTFVLFKGNTSSSVTGVEYGIYNNSSNNMRAGIYGAQSGSSTQVATEVDVFIMSTDGTTANWYKNNVLVTSFAVGSSNISSDIWLGSRLGTGKYYAGSIRAVAISNEEITPALRATIQAYAW